MPRASVAGVMVIEILSKCLTLTNHAYSPIIAVMNKGKFDGLPPAHQQVIVESPARRRPTSATST